jgi:hypothetical protein
MRRADPPRFGGNVRQFCIIALGATLLFSRASYVEFHENAVALIKEFERHLQLIRGERHLVRFALLASEASPEHRGP